MRNITITDKTTINPTEAYEFQYRFVFPTNTAVLNSEQYATIASEIATGKTTINNCGYSWVEFIIQSGTNQKSKNMLFKPVDYVKSYHTFDLSANELTDKFAGTVCSVKLCIHIKYANGSSEDIWSEETDFNVELKPSCTVGLTYDNRFNLSGSITVKAGSKECNINKSYVILEQDDETIYRERFYSKTFQIKDIDMSVGNTTPIYLYVEGITELGSKFTSPKQQIGETSIQTEVPDITMNWYAKNNGCIHYTISNINSTNYKKIRLLRYTVIDSQERNGSIFITAYQTPMTFESDINGDIVEFDDYTIQDNEKYVYDAFVYVYDNGAYQWKYVTNFIKDIICINMDAETLCDKNKNVISIYNSSSTTTDNESNIVINQPIESRFPKVTQITRKHYRTGSTTGVIRSMTYCENDATISQDVHSIYRWLLEQQRKMTPFLLKTLHGNMIVLIKKISSAVFDNTNCLQITFEWTEIANANSIIDLNTFGFSDFKLDSHWKQKNIEDMTTDFVIMK